MKTFNLILFALFCIPVIAQTKTLKVNISGFKSDNGYCFLYIFNDKKGFPKEIKRAVKVVKSIINNKHCEIEINDLPNDIYAITVVHDENQNGKLDTDFFGIPKEGNGCSNNPNVSGGPPSFDDCKFSFTGIQSNISIKVKYL